MVTEADSTLMFETTAEGIGSADLFVQSILAREALSTPYEVELTLTCNIEGGLSPDDVNALLSARSLVRFGAGATRFFAGVIREIEQLDMTADAVTSAYRAILVPRFWLSTLTRRSRAFNDMTIPDIIGAVLREMGLVEGGDFELRLNESYEPAREYVVQFEESDFAFLSRWMERLGMYYFFEEGEGNERLVVTDANNSHFDDGGDLESLAYDFHEPSAGGGSTHGTRSVHRWRRRNRIRPAALHVRDYNWRAPSRPVVGNAEIDADHGFGLQAHYGDHFRDDDEGARHAALRAELWTCGKETYAGHSSFSDMSPGFRFSVTGAPVGELDQEYLITAVVHRAAQEGDRGSSGSYSNEIEAIPFATQYRPPRDTPWPRIDGVVTGKVDAESISSAAPLDAQGRYKVVVPFDLYGGYGGKASRWIRKAEAYSGADYGMHMTLHVGAEVVLAHVNGDPDRPIIVATVPNATMSTHLTSGTATRSGLRSRSGIIIDFEDDA